MPVDILQQFLNRRLFDIGPDDTRLDRIRKAAAELATSLAKSRSDTVRLALVAFDPDVPPDEPSLADVATAIQRQWHTYTSCFADKSPRPLFRAVLLEAINLAMAGDAAIAAAVVLIARNVLPFFNVASESDVLLKMVVEAGEISDERADAEWSRQVEMPDPPESEIESKKAVSANQLIKVERIALLKAFAGAAGPTDAQGQPGTNPNPAWPNNAQQWSYNFAPRATDAVANAMDGALISMNERQMALSNAAAEFVRQGVSKAVSSTRTFAQSLIGVQRRTELLWWKEALYSHSTRTSYRALSPMMGAVQMAIDLHNQVPVFCPESVEYLLRETVNAAFGYDASNVASKPLQDLIPTLIQEDRTSNLRSAFHGLARTTGRGPLVALIADAFESGTLATGRFKIAIGIDGQQSFTPSDLSVWVFRELQAISATKTAAASSAKRPKLRATQEAQS